MFTSNLVQNTVGLTTVGVDGTDQAVFCLSAWIRCGIMRLLPAESQHSREMFSKCPRYFNQGPPAEMWSVVHFPFALINTGASMMSLPSQALKGLRSWSRSDVGATATLTVVPSAGGAWKVFSPASYPFDGSSKPCGSENLNSLPSLPLRESVRGLKVKSPAKTMAVTISGEVTKA